MIILFTETDKECRAYSTFIFIKKGNCWQLLDQIPVSSHFLQVVSVVPFPPFVFVLT